MTTPPTRSQRRIDRMLASPRWREATLYVGAVAVSITAVIFALKLWHMNIRIPLEYSGDSVLISAHFKTVLETGWYLYQPLLGAPHGQEYFDWKITDNLNMVFGDLMRLVTTDFAVVQNVYFLVGFPLAAITATWLFRLIGISRIITLPLAVLVAIAPYHFIRGEHHQWLSSYYPIPLALGIVYLILRGRPLWTRRVDRSPGSTHVFPPLVMTIAALALVSTVNSYYAIITALLIAFAGVLALLRTRDFRRFLGAVVAGGSIALVLLVSLVPFMLFQKVNGPNPEAIVRQPIEAEMYGLKFTQLILPMPGNRVPALSNFRALYDAVYPYPAESPALGFVGAVGFLAMFVFAAFMLTSLVRSRARAFGETQQRLGAIAVLVIVCFLLGTFGGLGTIASFFTSDLRGWNRISIHITILSLAGLGLLVDALSRRAATTRVGSVRPALATGVPIALALVLLVVGVFDQTGPATVPAYASVKTEWTSDAKMVSTIGKTVGKDASILQLPFRLFPESAPAVGSAPDSDQLKPFLHSSTLKWSGGGIKGRPASDWVSVLQTFSVTDQIDIAAAAGFEGVLLDRQSLDQNGGPLVAAFAAQLGTPAVDNGRYVFFSLEAGRDRISARWTPAQIARVGRIATLPVDTSFLPTPGNTTVLQMLGSYKPRLTMENSRANAISTHLSFDLTDTSGDSTIRITLPDGSTKDVAAGPTPTHVDLQLDVAPGQSAVEFSEADGSAFVRNDWDFGPVNLANVTAADDTLSGLLAIASR